MKNFLVLSLLVVAACGSKSKGDTSPTGGPGEPIVDPTMPSWAPKSCNDYHKAVVQALECEAVDQAKQDEIRASYDSASVAWKAEQDASAERIDAIAASCVSSAESVRAETADKCTAQ